MNKTFISLFLLFTVYANAQKLDTKLQSKLVAVIKDFHGDIGIFVYDFKANKTVSINADTIFPTASIVKIPILIGIMDKIEKGELNYHQRNTYTDSLFYSEGDDILSSFKPGSTIELSKLMMLMITISDNCASLWLQGLAGGGIRINQILDSMGMTNTRVNSRTIGREHSREIYGWGQTTPKEIAMIMKNIVDEKIISKKASDQMLRILSRQYWDEEALSEIPAGVFTADKNGALDNNRNEVMYVNARHPYILSIFTKNNADKRWESSNEAWVLMRKVSTVLWNYYNL